MINYNNLAPYQTEEKKKKTDPPALYTTQIKKKKVFKDNYKYSRLSFCFKTNSLLRSCKFQKKLFVQNQMNFLAIIWAQTRY